MRQPGPNVPEQIALAAAGLESCEPNTGAVIATGPRAQPL